MAWNVYSASSNFVFPDDPRCPVGSGKVVAAGDLVVLDNGAELAAYQALGITLTDASGSLSGAQTSALAAAQGTTGRAYVVAQLGLT